MQVGLAEPVDRALQALRSRVAAEMAACAQLEQLQGILEPLLVTSLGKQA